MYTCTCTFYLYTQYKINACIHLVESDSAMMDAAFNIVSKPACSWTVFSAGGGSVDVAACSNIVYIYIERERARTCIESVHT